MATCIISMVDDVHAICVQLALQRKNEEVFLWHWWDFPSIDRLTFSFDGIDNYRNPIMGHHKDNLSLWVHRGMTPVPSPGLHPADVRFVEHEASCMLYGMFNDVAERAFCVNPPEAVRKVRSKINELILAAKCKVAIPPTIFSNDPQEISSFFKDHSEVVMKHSGQVAWESSDGRTSFPYTTKVRAEHLKNDEQVSACPTIFQKLIKKEFEIRIVFMGNTIFSIKIDSQKSKTSIDWRKDYKSLPPCSIFEMPQNELEKIKRFIKASGLIYGSIDMVVSPSGEYFFLEVNETGQFLWIESLIPELPLLDCFTNLLVNKDSEYVYEKGPNSVKFADFFSECSDEAIAVRKLGHAERIGYGRVYEN